MMTRLLLAVALLIVGLVLIAFGVGIIDGRPHSHAGDLEAILAATK